MNLTHPLAFLPPDLRRPLFRTTLALTVVCFALFSLLLDPPLRTPLSSGIVSLALARTPEAAQAILTGWDARARLFAAFGLGFDFLFMPLYATALSAGLLLAGERLPRRPAATASLLGWGAYLAAGCDALENLALFSLLTGAAGLQASIAFTCAVLKFGLLFAGLAFALTARFLR